MKKRSWNDPDPDPIRDLSYRHFEKLAFQMGVEEAFMFCRFYRRFIENGFQPFYLSYNELHKENKQYCKSKMMRLINHVISAGYLLRERRGKNNRETGTFNYYYPTQKAIMFINGFNTFE